VGDWIRDCGCAIYNAKPCEVTASGRDFVLRDGDRLYYFVHDLARGGDEHVTTDGGGTGPRSLAGLKESIESVCWLDDGEILQWTQNPANGLCSIDCTRYPYGSNLVVRIAEIKLA
jgi:alpha-L-fucosidase